MAYRNDPDLVILSQASNEDLLLLADALMYKDEKHKKNDSKRLASTLWLDNDFKKCYPNNMRGLWKPIAEEIQKFGGHSGVNWIFRFNKGVLYREILIDVCKKLKVKKRVPTINYKKDLTSVIENAFLHTMIEISIEKMTDAQKRELIEGLKNIDGFKEQFKSEILSPATLMGVVETAFKMGGFKSYIFTLQLVNSISKAVIGRGLALSANAAISKGLSSFFSGPWGWVFFGVTSVWDILGPNKTVCLRAVTIVAYMRRKMEFME